MEKLRKIYEGKAKIIFETDRPGLVIQQFKEEATAFDGKKKAEIEGKGVANTQISAVLFKLLEEKGIKTHFRALVSPNELATIHLKMIPVEVVVRNVAAGSLAKRLGYAEGRTLKRPLVEFYFKNDELGDPIINEDHIAELKLATPAQLKEMRETALKVNQVLREFFGARGLELVDFKLEFGVASRGEIILGDEISPDTCRFWDKESRKKLDKDRFRHDLGEVEEAYQEVLKRVTSPD